MEWEEDRDPEDAARSGGGGLRATYYSLLSMGWRVGKKLAMTGAAITSAPVVVPPLFIFSTIWFALSFPFAICFAGYAVTNRMLKALLSRAPTPVPIDGLTEERVVEEAESYDLVGVEGKEEVAAGVRNRELEREEVTMDDRGEFEEMAVGEEEEEEEEKCGVDEAEREVQDVQMHDLVGVREEEKTGGGVQYGEIESEEIPKDDMGVLEQMPAVEAEKSINEVERHDLVRVPDEEEAREGVHGPEVKSEEVPLDDRRVFEELSVGEEEKSANEAEREVQKADIYDLLGVPDEEKAGGVIYDGQVESEDAAGGLFPVVSITDEEMKEVPVGVEEGDVDSATGRGLFSVVDETPMDDKGLSVEMAVREEEKSANAEDATGAFYPDMNVINEGMKKIPVEDVEEGVAAVPNGDLYAGVSSAERKEVPVEDKEESVAAEVGQPILSIGLVEHEVIIEQPSPIPEYLSADAEEMNRVIPLVAEGEGSPIASLGIVERELNVENPGAGEEPSFDVALVSGEERVAAMPVTVESLQVQLGPEVVVHRVEVTEPINEDLYSEEKIWEQIDAMRAIIGYTAARHLSFMEELKALYIFTGVEPPVSTGEPSDLVDVSNKLHFLKSVVGVE